MADLGDRMKAYEAVEAQRRLDQDQPVCARIDGKCFSKFTTGLSRPYDERLSRLMIETMHHLVVETGALAGYTQSDEITLLWLRNSPGSQLWLDGRTQKLTSILASITTAYFNAALPRALPEREPGTALFDARVWNLPTKEEAANLFLWRQRDAIKNAISQAARAHFSHKQIHGKNGHEMRAMLADKGVVWNDYAAFFRIGTFAVRRVVTRAFTAAELDVLPPKHQARANPSLMVERSDVNVSTFSLERTTNRVAVLFDGEEADAGGRGRDPNC